MDVKKSKTYETYDASHLTNLGKIHWYIEKEGDKPVSTNAVFSITKKNEDQILCLNIFSGNTCDKYFIVSKDSDSTKTSVKIIREQDKENPLKYSFHIDNKVVQTGEIIGYRWVIDNNTISTEETCTYIFSEYRDVRIKLFLHDSTGNTTELTDSFSMLRPLKFTK